MWFMIILTECVSEIDEDGCLIRAAMLAFQREFHGKSIQSSSFLLKRRLGKYAIEHCFESPNVIALNEKLEEFGYKVCFMAEYFLPDINEMKELTCNYEIKVLQPEDFEQYYTDEWGNALCKSRKQLDKLAVGAFDNRKLVGLAGCSADCETMYQIGVDVLPEYRRKGIASALTSRLAMEILKLGKVPFYCAAWSNLKSVRNAIKCGFRPAWVELTARSNVFVDEMNK